MAINLWKIGGKPTSFNPLPVGGAFLPIGIGEFVLTLKAKSNLGATLTIDIDGSGLVNGSGFANTILTNTSLPYTFNLKNTSPQTLFIADLNAKGDIIIDSIQLIQKPLPKLTINGIDGFKSGKWTLHANASVIDDETLVLNATAVHQYSTLKVNVAKNTNYILSLQDAQRLAVYNEALSNAIAALTVTNTMVFNSGDNAVIQIVLSNTTTGQFTFKRPMLNLGSIPAPYEKKRGDRMVMPVPKGNLISSDVSQWEQGSFNSGDGTPTVSASRIRLITAIDIKPNTPYFINKETGYETFIFFYNGTTFISGNGFNALGLGVTSPPNANKVKIALRKTDNSGVVPSEITSIKPQLEQGTIPTPYQPYAVQLNKKPQHALVKAKTGLSFNGISDYLQLPSMTMDSVEIECLIDSVQPQNNPLLVDARVGLTNGYLSYTGNLGSGFDKLFVDGIEKTSKLFSDIPRNQRAKVKVSKNTPFTDDLTLFTSYTFFSGSMVKGILYKVTCYLNNAIVAQYDFEKPSNIVGDKVLPASDYYVQGKNMLLTDSSGWQDGNQVGAELGLTLMHKTLITVKPNTTYTMNCDPTYQIGIDEIKADASKTWRGWITGTSTPATNPLTFTTAANATQFRVFLKKRNFSAITLAEVSAAKPMVEESGSPSAYESYGMKLTKVNNKNLIPSFEDARWSLHANTQVLGKDVLRLNATAASQDTTITIPVLPSTNYLLKGDLSKDGYMGGQMNGSFRWVQGGVNASWIYTTGASQTTLFLTLKSLSSGTFDFIKPQLYQLDGKEGTIVGNAINLKKQSKRSFYSKR